MQLFGGNNQKYLIVPQNSWKLKFDVAHIYP